MQKSQQEKNKTSFNKTLSLSGNLLYPILSAVTSRYKAIVTSHYLQATYKSIAYRSLKINNDCFLYKIIVILLTKKLKSITYRSKKYQCLFHVLCKSLILNVPVDNEKLQAIKASC